MIREDNTLWTTIGERILINVVSYPIEYAKVLIQIGHEPIPPRPTTNLFRRPALALPNVFQYVKYIKNVDGYSGCYRGLIPKLCAHTICVLVSDETSYKLTCMYESNKENEENYMKKNSEDEGEDGQKHKSYIFEFIRDLISKTTAIIVSHPLNVIALRMIAQFVGKETKYNGLFTSFVEVYRENGIMGYYAGLVPRLIGNAIVLVIVSSSTYAVDKYLSTVTTEHDIKPIICSTINFIATTITYPFLVVSHCMAVNDCGLVAGLPPHMPIWNSWLECWAHLSAANQLKRGNSLLWRYYTGPSVIINGIMTPLYK
ncbi:mitochondrial carrier homolog 2-like [Hylaeus volcanicus]|uniref:mitochondrial carrier homolog 2-like n=1 Tax=Hylaeus volcanicus TaxID=313075 RepID=UPI0023B7D665|nr:mitochondrial carrier homolog 2-like [Hylaeus volcanicus]